LYMGYRFGARNVLSSIRDRREQQGVQLVSPEAPTESLLDLPHQPDLRELLTPKKPDLRDSIKGKQQPAPPVKKVTKMVLVVPDPAFNGPTSRYGTNLFDIRERSKLEEAKKKEKEAEEALKKAGADRIEEEAKEADRKIRELTRYRDALVKDREGSSSKPTGSHGAVRARKRTRSPTPPPRPSHSSPSSSRTPLSTSRRRETVRAGKGKGRRSSYSRSQSPRRHPREPRPSARTVPGLCLGPRDERRSQRKREFSPSRTPPRRPRSPSGSPPWQTSQRRRRR
jgi:hypothetical protein